jgi:hypothetical protein
MSETRVTNALVEEFRKRQVPRDLRLMAAQGVLPLKPEDLLELWTDLIAETDAEIRAAAAASLTRFASTEFLPILSSRETPNQVLAWAARHRPERELREAVLQNPSLTDAAIEGLAPSLSTELAELVVINQTRLLRSTALLEALETNPGLSNDQRRRLRELRETFRIGLEPMVPAEPPPVAGSVAPAAAPAAVDESPETFIDLPGSDEEAVVCYLSEEERHQTEKVSAVQKLYRLNTAEKIITALKGNREERAILIRDPNRLVASSVLGSPRLTEVEVETFASMKNVSEEILRHIGTHHEWTRRYAVISNLVKNPRTPIGLAMTMVARLNPRDMKSVTLDKNVPEPVRRQALRFVRSPGEAGGRR